MRKSQKGFTLVEVIVSIAVFLLVLSGVFMLFQQAKKDEIEMEQKTETFQNARMALDLLVREIRMAGYKSEGSVIFFKATDKKIGFSADIDTQHDGAENVLYYVDNTPDAETPNPNDYILKKRIEYTDGSSAPKVDVVAYGMKLNGLQLKYYDFHGDEIVPVSGSLTKEQLALIHSVSIKINTTSYNNVYLVW